MACREHARQHWGFFTLYLMYHEESERLSMTWSAFQLSPQCEGWKGVGELGAGLPNPKDTRSEISSNLIWYLLAMETSKILSLLLSRATGY